VGEQLTANEEGRSSIKLIIQFNSIQFSTCLFTQRLHGLRPHINPAKTDEYTEAVNRKLGEKNATYGAAG